MSNQFYENPKINYKIIISSTFSKRIACISTEIGTTSYFPVRTGVLQGDIPSPGLFKLGANPLALKIVIDADISLPPELPFSTPPDSLNPDPITGFADDTNLFISPNPTSFLKCHNILDSFSKLSNLNINTNKPGSQSQVVIQAQNSLTLSLIQATALQMNLLFQASNLIKLYQTFKTTGIQCWQKFQIIRNFGHFFTSVSREK